MPGSSHDSQNQTEESSQHQAIRSSLRAWASWVMAKSEQRPALHHCLLLNQLTSVCRGEIDRLMVLMPPGSAKSTYASLLFPAWWFTQHPDSSVIATSHTTSLAEQFGRQVRELVERVRRSTWLRTAPQPEGRGSLADHCQGRILRDWNPRSTDRTARRSRHHRRSGQVACRGRQPRAARTALELVPLRSDHSAQATRSDRAGHDALA